MGGRDKVWTARSAAFQPSRIYELTQLVAVTGRLSLAPDDRAKPKHDKKRMGVVLECVDVEGITNLKHELSFGPRGELLSDESLVVSYEYADYTSWAGRQFPHFMRAREGKTAVVEVEVEELGAAAQLDSSVFVPPADALAWDWCDDATPPQALDKPVPLYPERARGNRVQGTVSVYAVIEPNGRLQDLTVVRSAGSDLDRATLSVLAGWRYQPAKCCGKPIPMETVLDVTYGLRE